MAGRVFQGQVHSAYIIASIVCAALIGVMIWVLIFVSGLRARPGRLSAQPYSQPSAVAFAPQPSPAVATPVEPSSRVTPSAASIVPKVEPMPVNSGSVASLAQAPGEPALPSPVALAQAPGTQLAVEDTFDNVNTGSRPSGQEWRYGYAGGTITVQDALGLPGKALKLVQTDQTHDIWVQRAFPLQQGSFSLECLIRPNNLRDGIAVSVVRGNTVVAQLEISDSRLMAQQGGRDSVALEPFAFHVWYTVRFDVHPRSGYYDIYINNVKRGEKLALVAQADGADGWRVSSGTLGIGALYISTVKVVPR